MFDDLDLRSLNFYPLSALQFITVQQVLKELASFHATGLHFMQNYPGGEAGLHKDYPMIFTKELSAGAPEGVN